MYFEFLSDKNVDSYLKYLGAALEQEPDMMWVESVDEEAIRARMLDPFYQNTKSILAIENGKVLGRIEYHFYGCLQDGFRMAYVDWVYVLKDFRCKGIATRLFEKFEEDCRKHEIDQYFLIRAANDAANRFYHGFRDVDLSDEPMLRKDIKA